MNLSLLGAIVQPAAGPDVEKTSITAAPWIVHVDGHSLTKALPGTCNPWRAEWREGLFNWSSLALYSTRGPAAASSLMCMCSATRSNRELMTTIES